MNWLRMPTKTSKVSLFSVCEDIVEIALQEPSNSTNEQDSSKICWGLAIAY
jgi:hypothetical protein